MTVGSKKTEWTLAEIKPEAPGLYLRQSKNQATSEKAFWNGEDWFAVKQIKKTEPRIFATPHRDQDRRWKPIPIRIVDSIDIGSRFHMLVFLEDVGRDAENKRWLAKFRCDCGNVKAMNVYEVRRGDHKSCGCLSGSSAAIERARIGQRQWIKQNHAKILEVNRRVAEQNRGKSKPLGKVGKWELNIHARYYKIADSHGHVLDGWNLAELVRKNEHLFDKGDVEWVGGVCKAVKRLYTLYEKRRNVRSWKGWKRVSENDRVEVTP